MVEDGPSRVVAFRGDFALLLWGRGITVEEAQVFGRATRRELSAAPRVGSLVWLTGLPASAPTEEVRAVLARIIANAPPSFTALHYVVEGEGFGSAVARAVITGLNLSSRATLPLRVHATIDEAMSEIARELEWPRAEAAAVRQALDAMRADWAAHGGTPIPQAI